MTTFQPITQLADVSIAEVSFKDGNRVFTTVTNSAYVAARWITEAMAIYGPSRTSHVHQPVGLHIERSLPNGAIALLQLFVGNRCLLYQLMHRDDWPPRDLYTFFTDERFCFTCANAEVVVLALQSEFGFKVRVALDLGQAASTRLGREDLRWAGLEQLAMEMMRIEIMRRDELPQSAWGERELPQWLVIFASANQLLHLLRARQDCVQLWAPSVSLSQLLIDSIEKMHAWTWRSIRVLLLLLLVLHLFPLMCWFCKDDRSCIKPMIPLV